MKKLILASDHAGFKMKEDLKKFFKLKGYELEDLGPETDQESVSYAKQGLKLAHYIADHPQDLGIAVCGTGLGISIAANRIKGVRAARVTSISDAKLAKKHNNANILAIGGRITQTKKAVDMFNAFVREDYEGGRHDQRIKDLD